MYICEFLWVFVGLGYKVLVIFGLLYFEFDDGIELIELLFLDLFEEDNVFFVFCLSYFINVADLLEWLVYNFGVFGELYVFGLCLEKFLCVYVGDFDVLYDN